jgi:hypothetical protein
MFSQILIQHPSVYCHPCIAPTKALEQKLPMYFQSVSPGKMLLPLATIHHLWQYECSVKHYNEVSYSALPFYFHWLYRQCHGLFDCKNAVHQ